jgi:hypothetical protein
VDDCQLLIVMAPADLRDELVDTLMECDFVSGFNMTTTAGFSSEHSQFDLREQVEGYREVFKFEILHGREQQQPLLEALRRASASGHLRYWVIPLREQGHL